jgi:hypothetical protein
MKAVLQSVGAWIVAVLLLVAMGVALVPMILLACGLMIYDRRNRVTALVSRLRFTHS